jgi:hypothetical protein
VAAVVENIQQAQVAQVALEAAALVHAMEHQAQQEQPILAAVVAVQVKLEFQRQLIMVVMAVRELLLQDTQVLKRLWVELLRHQVDIHITHSLLPQPS